MITVTILTKNNAQTLKPTLDALSAFAEVLVFDTGSTDATLSLAQSYPNVKVIVGNFIGFGKTHNQASQEATYDWILSIDSDEIVSQELASEILSLEKDPLCVYGFLRKNYYRGKWIRWCGGWHPDDVLRLYHRKYTQFSDDAVHEKVLSQGMHLRYLQGTLDHTPYRTMSDFLSKMQIYSTLFAEDHAGKKTSVTKALLHSFSAFIKSYILKRGFMGGKEGLIISLYNSHVTLYKYLKLEEKQ